MEPMREMQRTTYMGTTGLMCTECRAIVTDGEYKAIAPLKENRIGRPFQPLNAQPKYVPVVSCSHNLTPFQLKTSKVYLSAARDIKEPALGPSPDMAAYLDTAWLPNGIVFANNGTKTKAPDGLEILYVRWPDMGILRVDTLDFVVRWILAGAGKRNVEIGCIGGHGRTGTCAAALLVKEGATAVEAIAQVHEKYCQKAVESQAQEWLLEDYETFVRTGVIAEVRKIPTPAFTYGAWNGGLDKQGGGMVGYGQWWDD
jgi:hypothetical protein